MPSGIKVKGKTYSEITNHDTKSAAKETQKRYKKKGWAHVIIRKDKKGYTVYGKYKK